MDIVIDEVTNLLLEMGVSLLNGGKKLLGGNHIGLLGSHSLLLRRLLSHLHVWLNHGLLHLRLLVHGSWLLHLVVVLSLSSLVWHGSALVVLRSLTISSVELLLRLLGLHDLEKLLDDLS